MSNRRREFMAFERRLIETRFRSHSLALIVNKVWGTRTLVRSALMREGPNNSNQLA